MRVREVFRYFLMLGLTGFGGPLSLIAIMQRDLVQGRRWISETEFLQIFSLIKSMPGPVAFQVALYLGRSRAGFWGGTVAGFGLLLPSFILMVLFGAFYDAFKGVPTLQSYLIGMQASVLVMVVVGTRGLVGPFYQRSVFWFLFLVSAAAFWYSLVPEPVLIIGGSAAWVFFQRHRFDSKNAKLPAFLFLVEPEKLKELALVCAKAGAFVFGTGLAIVPLLENDFVLRLNWMTQAEFLDALAAGQITPGPVSITAAFIGYKASGFVGAAVATVAMFGPSFFHMMTWFPRAVATLARQRWVADFTFAVAAIVAGTIAVSVLRLASAWGNNPIQYLIVLITAVLVWKTRLPSWAIILSGGASALVLQFIF